MINFRGRQLEFLKFLHISRSVIVTAIFKIIIFYNNKCCNFKLMAIVYCQKISVMLSLLCKKKFKTSILFKLRQKRK